MKRDDVLKSWEILKKEVNAMCHDQSGIYAQMGATWQDKCWAILAAMNREEKHWNGGEKDAQN